MSTDAPVFPRGVLDRTRLSSEPSAIDISALYQTSASTPTVAPLAQLPVLSLNNSSPLPVSYRYNLISPLPTHLLTALPSPAASPPISDATGSHSPLSALEVRQVVGASLPPKRARPPAAANTIRSSPHRPHVPADRRLLLWTTPHSFQTHNSAIDAGVSARMQQQIFEKLLEAHTPETRESYGAGLLRFTQFCDRHEIPEHLRMPTHRYLLSAFVADASGTCSGKAIRNWLNGLQLWHVYNDAPWHGDEGWVPHLKRSADRAGAQFKRPPRPPITLAHLRALHSALDINTSRGAALWAAALAAFWGCCRLGELLVPSAAKFTLQRHTTRDARIDERLVNGRRVVSIPLVWTKTTQLAGGECLLTETPEPDIDLCPVHFLEFTSTAFSAALLERVFGHSYRIGGSVELLKAGVPPEIVMKLGGWSSLYFLIYWRRLEEILPAAITRAWDVRLREFARSHGHRLNANLSID
ncbi:hypothetical protein C8F01DRAFT_1363314 [Mycena amicta]|nr:hypothetical protein C8F01DRAFT_1363314 [Mycena amicta]